MNPKKIGNEITVTNQNVGDYKGVTFEYIIFGKNLPILNVEYNTDVALHLFVF